MAAIALVYGSSQPFRFRYRDITIPGHVEAAMPLRRSVWRLNNGPPTFFYVEQVPDTGLDWRFAYKQSPARLRLPNLGDFNIEIPVDRPELREGENHLLIDIEDRGRRVARLDATLVWDPTPVPLPLDLSDLAKFDNIQQIGQVVNGAFDLDPGMNVIRSRAPVAPDALLVLGAPHASQDATYDIRFADPDQAKYLGLSDFFVRHEAEDPPIGIKPGWSTAGLATLTYRWRPGSLAEVRQRPVREPHPCGEARAWLASADNSNRSDRWLVKTDPPARLPIAAGVTYHVRHQVLFGKSANRVRFRIWPDGESEPVAWLCDESDARLGDGSPKFSLASFALFQHSGASTEWSRIRVVPLS